MNSAKKTNIVSFTNFWKRKTQTDDIINDISENFSPQPSNIKFISDQLSKAIAELSFIGIEKNGEIILKNSRKINFRSIDDIMSSVGKVMGKFELSFSNTIREYSNINSYMYILFDYRLHYKDEYLTFSSMGRASVEDQYCLQTAQTYAFKKMLEQCFVIAKPSKDKSASRINILEKAVKIRNDFAMDIKGKDGEYIRERFESIMDNIYHEKFPQDIRDEIIGCFEESKTI